MHNGLDFGGLFLVLFFATILSKLHLDKPDARANDHALMNPSTLNILY